MRPVAACLLVLCFAACGAERSRSPGTRAPGGDAGGLASDSGLNPGQDGGGVDGSPADAGVQDSGALDASAPEAGPWDAGPTDAAVADSGAGPGLDAGGGPISVAATFTYSDGTEVDLEGCYFCDATLDDGSGQTLLRFQMGTGYLLWTLTLPAGVALGPTTLLPGFDGPHVSVSESTPELPSALHGSYLAPGQSGTLTLTELDLRPGGAVAGTVDARITKLGNASVNVRLQAQFRAQL